jgi:hypothetical protein
VPGPRAKHWGRFGGPLGGFDKEGNDLSSEVFSLACMQSQSSEWKGREVSTMFELCCTS